LKNIVIVFYNNEYHGLLALINTINNRYFILKIYTLNKILSIFILVVCITFDCFVQFDTIFFRQYPEKLVITLFQSEVRKHGIGITPSQVQDFKRISTLDYASQAKKFTVLSFDYDILVHQQA
jgi:hypothetical protein